MARFAVTGTAKVTLGVAIGLAIGAAGGAGAISLTRPTVEMAPTVATPVARLDGSSGVVTVKGRVAEVYGDRFVLQDASGRTMIDAGRDAAPARGATVQVQGRYDGGQLRASYLVDGAGKVTPVGRPPRHDRHGARHEGPAGGPGAPCAPGALPPPAPGVVPPPAGAVPPPPPAR